MNLTTSQKISACSYHPRLFLEASPGSGKTTIAAERFGILAFTRQRSFDKGVLAVSFTRSATSELANRIRRRWGDDALRLPNAVLTIDSLLAHTLEHLLRTGSVEIPGRSAPDRLNILDSWRGQRGAVYRKGTLQTVSAGLSANRTVVPVLQRTHSAGYAPESKETMRGHLSSGLLTHDDVRNILSLCIKDDDLRKHIAIYLGELYGHVLVDEIFDANQLDIEFLKLASSGGVSITVIGDPWQALYEWRGALVPEIRAWLGQHRFHRVELHQSFRFDSSEMKTLTSDLRSGKSVTVPGLENDPEVVLARQWNHLWKCEASILPLSFGNIGSSSDASLAILLDSILQSRSLSGAMFIPEALHILRISAQRYRAVGYDSLAEVRNLLTSDSVALISSSLEEAISQLSGHAVMISGQAEKIHDLSQALNREGVLIPGMTFHQSKGREWTAVGVLLTASDVTALQHGLDANIENHRALYVGLTRAKSFVGAVRI